MDILPEEIVDIINDYILQLEIKETREKTKKTINIIKQFSHNVYICNFGTEAGIIIGNIKNRFCLRCHEFVIINYKWKKSNIEYSENHFCKCS